MDLIDHSREVAETKGEGFTDDPAGMLDFIVRLTRKLQSRYPSEGWSLARKDAGENIYFYLAAGVKVMLSRLMRPDGQLVKVLSDAGPGGTNGPEWVGDGQWRTDWYVPLKGQVVVVDPPPPSVNPGVDLWIIPQPIKGLLDEIHADNIAMVKAQSDLQTTVQDLLNASRDNYDLLAKLVTQEPKRAPSYIGRLPFIGTIRLDPQ